MVVKARFRLVVAARVCTGSFSSRFPALSGDQRLTNGVAGEVEAAGDLGLAQACSVQTADALLLGLGSPEQEDEREEQDHRHPREGGCHGSDGMGWLEAAGESEEAAGFN
jgi:hypothetical protein